MFFSKKITDDYMFIKKYINSIVSHKVSLTSAFISVLFLWAFFYLRLNELSEKNNLPKCNLLRPCSHRINGR